MKVLLRVSAVAAGAAVGLLLAEILLRLAPTLLPSAVELQVAAKPGLRRVGIYRYHAEYRQLWRPDDWLRERILPTVDTVVRGHPEYPRWPIRTSDLGMGPAGFRDQRVGEEPLAVVLGDSFGFGVGVEQQEIWSERLERSLGREIVNLSQVGACSLQEKRIYDRYGSRVGAPLVFWLYFENDLKENLRFQQWLEPGRRVRQAVRQPDAACGGRLHRGLESFSISYELLLWWRRACRYSAYPPAPRYHDDDLDLVFCRDHDVCDAGVQRIMLDAGWPLTRAAVLDTAARAAARGGELVVVIVPAKEQVYWEQFRLMGGGWPANDRDRLTTPIAALCAEHQIRCLELVEPLRRAARGAPQLYFPVDIHWNAAGHVAVADSVEAFLREEDLVGFTP